MSRGLKYTFLVHAIGEFILGLAFIFIPETLMGWMNWTPVDVNMDRVYGSVILAIGLGSYLGFRSTEWTQVRIIVRIQNVVTALYLLVALYTIIFAGGSTPAWSGVAWGAVFGALFGYFGRAPTSRVANAPQPSSWE
jgi:hypothetical protein